MFVDVAKVSLRAGKGGDGAVSFRHEIYIPKGGPDGGDGGKGGDIIFRADKDTNTLIDFRFTPILNAEDGKNGSGQRSAGRSGRNLVVEVPVGTCVYRTDDKNAKNDTRVAKNTSRCLIADLTKDGQEIVVARGGDGGFGNAHFKSSTRQTPFVAELGEPGEEFEAELELKSVADVGLVGLPNAGKSTFLSVVSNAKPEIADYPFTTITPNLGVATIDGYDLLLADIPGLIEGAAKGKGLGHDFLRHVDRTAVLLHLIDIYAGDAGDSYATIRNELDKYSDLAIRPEIVALTKCEGVDDEIIKMQIDSIHAQNPNAKVFAISSSAHLGVTELLRGLRKIVMAQNAHRNDVSVESSQQENVEGVQQSAYAKNTKNEPIPIISLSDKAMKDTWQVKRLDDGKFLVTGEKIEKFARRTDLNNYASLNRLRDIMKKFGIRAELTTRGAQPDSIVSIAGKEFTLMEDY